MISVAVDKNSKKLRFDFDIPFPAGLEDNPEWSSFTAFLGRSARPVFSKNESGLTGFSVTLSEWIEFMRNVLPNNGFVFHKDLLDKALSHDLKEQGRGLQINFHQDVFDSNERYWSFILNQGNFAQYFLNRFNWYFFPQNTIVSPFPLHVDLEASSACNMNCPMCYRDQLKETGFMDMDIFRKAIDECAENNVFSVRLSWRGETLTHPKIEEMIAYATSKIKNVSFLTNAFFIDDKKIDCFIKSRLSYIAVSFDGIDEIYEAVRHPAKFKESLSRLSTMKAMKEKSKSMLPQVRLCTIWPAIKDDPKAYHDAMKDVSDYMVCNPYINFKGPMKIKPDFICQYPWERVVVAFNGDAQCCTGWNSSDIILGNVRDRSIRDMWHCDLMNKIRDLHSNGRRMELRSCADCRHGAKGDPDIDIYDIVKRRH